MNDKSLKDKAIDIKGKKYVLVSDRVLYFNETYDKGSIITNLVSNPESDQIIVQAIIRPVASDTLRQFTGYSQAIKGDGMVNKTAALENAETSAVGRALAMMGIGVLDSIASVDEINKAQGSTGQRKPTYASVKQIQWMRTEAQRATGLEEAGDIDAFIEELTGQKPNLIPGYQTAEVVEKIRIVKLMKTDNPDDDITKDQVYDPDVMNFTDEKLGEEIDKVKF